VNEPPPQDGRIGLALSGGGARCFAQIGALKALEDEGYQVDAIAANSSAAVLGALYAACSDAGELEAIVRGADFASLLVADGSTGLIGHEGIDALLADFAPDTFEELAIPLAVPTTDIERAELLIFREGPLRPPVCASNAFPGLFVPVEYRGRHLMDGGMINNFPVDIIRTMTSRPALAIDVRPSASGPLDLDKQTPSTFLGKVGALVGHGASTSVDILMQAYGITQSRLIEIMLAMHPPDVWLRPELSSEFGIQDFSRLDDSLEIGYRSVREAVASGRFASLAGRDPH
jgi:NTE family protein